MEGTAYITELYWERPEDDMGPFDFKAFGLTVPEGGVAYEASMVAYDGSLRKWAPNKPALFARMPQFVGLPML